MRTLADVDKLIRQTRKYEFSDGLRELQMALLFFLFGLLSWLIFEPRWWAFLLHLKRSHGQWAYWSAALLVLFFPSAAAWIMISLMTRLRRRWLWRTSGMVKPSNMLIPRRVTLLSMLILVAGIFLGAGVQNSGYVNDLFLGPMLWAAVGWATGYVTIELGRSIGLGRFIWLGVSGILVSTVLLFVPLSLGQAGLVFGAAWSIIFGGSGVIALRHHWSSQQE